MPDYTVEEVILGHEKAFRPERAAGIDVDIQYKLTGDGGGDWIIGIHDGKCLVTQGIHPDPKLTLTADAHDLKDILLGKMDGMMAFMQGKLHLQGDINLAMKLPTLFKM
jgi:putative sterol carrier protein